MEKPNLFAIGTSELSQDAFITWLLQWADPKYANVDTELNRIGISFLKSLIATYDQNLASNLIVNRVAAGRKDGHKDIDIWVKVNDEIFIIIEDKTHTKEHSNQLERYLQQTKQYKNSTGQAWQTIVPVYLKTGNECMNGLLQKDPFKLFTRKDLLSVLPVENKNHILADFRDHILKIEDRTNEYLSVPYEKWEWYAIQGFYCALQRAFLEDKDNRKDNGWSSWSYVPNQSGGFQAMYWHWNKYVSASCSLYFQITDGKHLYIRAADVLKDNNSTKIATSHMYQIFDAISNNLHERFKDTNIRVTKAGRFKGGMSAAVTEIFQNKQNSFISVKPNGLIDMDATIKFLLTVEKLLESVCENTREAQ